MTDIVQGYSFRIVVWALYIFLLAPLVCVVIVSFNYEPVQSFPPSAWSLRWYGEALRNSNFVNGAFVSAWVALGATLIATPIGVMAALGLWSSSSRFKPALEALFIAPIIVPGLVTGISLLVALSAVEMRAAPVKLLIGHVLIVLPYVIRTTLASLAQINPSLKEAAETLGASYRQTLFEIILPLVRPGIVAGMIFGFILSFDDVNVSLFLVDARTTTLPISVMSYLQYSFDPSVAAISSLMIAMTFVITLLLERMFGLKRLFAGH
ncbi:ABC transporter permease [Chelatococcus asaccharovorans]|uniref:ABC transporter permease n=1 Tax=Chelatococcus asaccharovorans TaxID=28210 RepID=UPI00224C783F|nr:ABC transporter permease [Chelatococcus asaccharovorans]CAH1650294.1 putative spermidine/putrescine transport system permease protein [Chelatococcus asaccharovorans]CAH1692176.1 putative spermidine/putrescine transport system permease protein [Chelatococcus asaccharovorans]